MKNFEQEILRARSFDYVLVKLTTAQAADLKEALGFVLHQLRDDDLRNIILTLKNGSQIELTSVKK